MWSALRFSITAASKRSVASSLQHVGGHFQHVDAVVRQQRQRQRRRCRDCRPRRPGTPAAARMCASSAVVVDLPLVPVMPTKRAREPAARTARNSSSASERIGTPAARAARGDRMRLRQRVRNARREHQRVESRHRRARARRRRPRSAASRGRPAVVPGDDLGAHRAQRPRRRQAVRPSPTTAKRWPAKMWAGNAHRIFSVARPTSARIIEMIQNRMTMVGSAQPFFSK